MEDVDKDPFEDHDKTEPKPTDETFPLIPGKGGVPAWGPKREQETLFGGESQKNKLAKKFHLKIFQCNVGIIKDFHFNNFDIIDGELYYKGEEMPLTKNKGELKLVERIAEILGKGKLRDLGFDIPKGKLTARQTVALNKMEENLPSTSDVTNSDDTEMQEITKNISNSVEDLISQMEHNQTQTDDLLENPLCELLGLDKEMKRIRGQLKVAVAKKVQLQQHIELEKGKLAEIEIPLEYSDDQCKEIVNRIEELSDKLKASQESINLLKGDLTNQITSFKATTARVLDKDTSLAEKIRTLFREQGITIASILMAIRMAIGVLVEALIPGGGGGAASPAKDENDVKEWLRNKLKALASFLGKLGIKAAEAFPDVIGVIISWVLNRAKEVVGWLSQNLWALV